VYAVDAVGDEITLKGCDQRDATADARLVVDAGMVPAR
jgi:hypothetical protein